MSRLHDWKTDRVTYSQQVLRPFKYLATALMNFPAFYGTGSFITVFPTDPHPEPDQSNPYHPSDLSKIHFNICHPLTSWSS
jgi:hypothetical protein